MKEAYYRNKDVFGVSVARADIVNKSYKCTHTATHRTSVFLGGFAGWKTIKEAKSTKPTTYVVGGNGDAIAYTVNLFGNRTTMNMNMTQNVYEYYDDETIQVKFQCKATSKKNVKFVTHYQHSKTSKSISPSVSASAGGISVGVSGSSTNYYEEITRNAYLEYNHI